MTRFVIERMAVDGWVEELFAESTSVVNGARVEPYVTAPSTSRFSPGFSGAIQDAPRVLRGRICSSASN